MKLKQSRPISIEVAARAHLQQTHRDLLGIVRAFAEDLVPVDVMLTAAECFRTAEKMLADAIENEAEAEKLERAQRRKK